METRSFEKQTRVRVFLSSVAILGSLSQTPALEQKLTQDTAPDISILPQDKAGTFYSIQNTVLTDAELSKLRAKTDLYQNELPVLNQVLEEAFPGGELKGDLDETISKVLAKTDFQEKRRGDLSELVETVLARTKDGKEVPRNSVFTQEDIQALKKIQAEFQKDIASLPKDLEEFFVLSQQDPESGELDSKKFETFLNLTKGLYASLAANKLNRYFDGVCRKTDGLGDGRNFKDRVIPKDPVPEDKLVTRIAVRLGFQSIFKPSNYGEILPFAPAWINQTRPLTEEPAKPNIRGSVAWSSSTTLVGVTQNSLQLTQSSRSVSF